LASRLSPRLVYWIFALFLATVAGITGLWFISAAQVREQIAVTGRAIAGDSGIFTVKTLDIAGFPFSFEAWLKGITISGKVARGPWEWRAEKAIVHLAPWRGRDARFELTGKHKLRFHAGRVPMDVELTTTSAPGEVQITGTGQLVLIKISATKIKAREVTTGSRFAADKASLQLSLHPKGKAGNADPSADLIMELNGIDLPEKLSRYLAPKLTRLATEIQVLSSLPLPVTRHRLARWREEGGSLEVRNLALEWGPVKIDGSGTLTLDKGLQPEASFAARITGFEETADALVAAGLIRTQDAHGVKMLLSLMSRRTSPGKGAEIRVPITIQERAIFVGPARLTRMPKIRW
jgi:hypothetical protein